MAKKRRGQTGSRREDFYDKPAYAMDVFPEKPKKPEPERPKEEVFHVGDAIGGQVASRLEQLKAQLTESEAAKVPQKATPIKPTKRSAKERLDEDPNLSFADLFDPQEDDDESFDSLLKSSKLDWQQFKED